MKLLLDCRCGPCKVIAPKFRDLCEKYEDVVFLKLDCNEENRVKFCFVSVIIFTGVRDVI